MASDQKLFAHAEQLEHLQGKLLPRLLRLARNGGRIRIWSPGCGSGAEPYSIALALLEVEPEARGLDIRIVATDPDSASLDLARLGQFSSDELELVPEQLLAGWIERIPGPAPFRYQFDSAVLELLQFRQQPLNGPYNLTTYFDVIFCCNVLQSLPVEAQRKAWADMIPLLAPGGVLYTGTEELLTGPALAKLVVTGRSAYLRLAA